VKFGNHAIALSLASRCFHVGAAAGEHQQSTRIGDCELHSKAHVLNIERRLARLKRLEPPSFIAFHLAEITHDGVAGNQNQMSNVHIRRR